MIKVAFSARLLSGFILPWLFGLSSLAEGVTIESLMEEDKLRIDATLSASYQINDDDERLTVNVRQPVTLTISVATHRWFADGSRVAPFGLRDVVIPAVSNLAINSTQRINGQTWATQTREVELYPTKAGNFSLPEVRVSVSVNTEQGAVAGSVVVGALGLKSSSL